MLLQEDIEVKKDTERADEIRALKKAWEDAEPGRAAKVRVVSGNAPQCCLKWLSYCDGCCVVVCL